jgi:hypothetical protein
MAVQNEAGSFVVIESLNVRSALIKSFVVMCGLATAERAALSEFWPKVDGQPIITINQNIENGVRDTDIVRRIPLGYFPVVCVGSVITFVV